MSPVTPRSTILRPLAALARRSLARAGGVALARVWLPEWLAGPLPDQRVFVERYRKLAQRAGIRLPAEEPRVSLAGRDKDMKLRDAALDRLDPGQAAAVGAGMLVEV